MDSAGEESACFSRSGKKFIASSVSNPEIIGYYSTDGEKCYLADSTKMSYFKPPRSTQVRMDLNQSIESAVRFPQASAGDGSLSHFLEWVVRNHTEIRGLGSDRWIEPDFVAAGGVLTRLLYTRYKPKSEWEIRAAKWKGTIYLCPIVTNSEENVHQVQASKFHAWAYKFKQHIVSDDPDTEPDTSRPVVELPEFRCVFKRRFAHHSVLFTSNVHAVQSVRVLEDPLPLKDLRLVEVKLKKILQHTGQWRFFTEDVLLRWWAQSFPAGTDQTLCGWRDNEGIVRGWTTYSLDQMIELGQGAWDPQACIKWCNGFLNRCAKLVVDDCDKAVYKFEKLPNGHLRTTRVPASYSFIPTAVLAKMGASDAA